MGVRVEIPVNLGRNELLTTIDEDDLYSQKYAITVLSMTPRRVVVPGENARMLCDAQLRRKVDEYRELLEFAHMKPEQRPAHPSVEWVCDSPHNYDWLYEVLTEVYEEHMERFGPFSVSGDKLKPLTPVHMMHPFGNQQGDYTQANPPPVCVPEEYRYGMSASRWDNAAESYRQYYIHELYTARWSGTKPPPWFVNGVHDFEQELASAGVSGVPLTRFTHDRNGNPIVVSDRFNSDTSLE